MNDVTNASALSQGRFLHYIDIGVQKRCVHFDDNIVISPNFFCYLCVDIEFFGFAQMMKSSSTKLTKMRWPYWHKYLEWSIARLQFLLLKFVATTIFIISSLS